MDEGDPRVVWIYHPHFGSLSDTEELQFLTYVQDSNQSGGGLLRSPVTSLKHDEGIKLRLEFTTVAVADRFTSNVHYISKALHKSTRPTEQPVTILSNSSSNGAGLDSFVVLPHSETTSPTEVEADSSTAQSPSSAFLSPSVQSFQSSLADSIRLYTSHSIPSSSDSDSIPTQSAGPAGDGKESEIPASSTPDRESGALVAVEVYEFPSRNEPDELIEELEFHFSDEPYRVHICEDKPCTYDHKSQTYLLWFQPHDAEKILQDAEQFLMGDETELIKVREYVDPLTLRTVVLVRSQKPLASERIVKKSFEKFGCVRKCERHPKHRTDWIIEFDDPKDAKSVVDKETIQIGRNLVTLSFYEETDGSMSPTESTLSLVEKDFEISEPVGDSTPPEKANFSQPEPAAGKDHRIHPEERCTPEGSAFFTSRSDTPEKGFRDMRQDNLHQSPAGSWSSSPAVHHPALPKTPPNMNPPRPDTPDQPDTADQTTQEEVLLLVSNLVDVDCVLLGCWFRTTCGVRPKTCQLSSDQTKALIKLPSSIDVNSLQRKCYDPVYSIHGTFLQLERLSLTSQLLVSCDPEIPHHDVLKMFFNTRCSGYQLVTIMPLPQGKNQIICCFNSHLALPPIIKQSPLSFSGITMAVCEFYPALGACDPSALFVFPFIKTPNLSKLNKNPSLMVYGVKGHEREKFEMMMKNPKFSRGDETANIQFKKNNAMVQYNNPEKTLEVFNFSKSNGIIFGKRKLDVSFETVVLTEVHDHYAVRLDGVPADVDLDKLKFYLSDVSSNIVKDIVFQEGSTRAVAYFLHAIEDFPLMSHLCSAFTLPECRGMKVKPELRASCLVFTSDAPECDTQYVELILDDVQREGSFREEFTVEEEKSGVWLINGYPDDVDELLKYSDKFKGTLVKRSEYLGPNVHKGICRKTLHLHDFISDKSKVEYILKRDSDGYKLLTSLLPTANHHIAEDGTITLKFPTEQYRQFTVAWQTAHDRLEQALHSQVESFQSSPLIQDVIKKVQPLLDESKQFLDVQVDKAGSNTVISLVGLKKNVAIYKEKLRTLVGNIEAQIQEERETKSQTLKLKHYESKFLELQGLLPDLKEKFRLKSLAAGTRAGEVTLTGRNANVDQAAQEVKKICKNICTEKAKKSKLFLEMCNNSHAAKVVQQTLQAECPQVVCDIDNDHIIAHASTSQIAKTGIRCIEKVVWEEQYPLDRKLNTEERKLLAQERSKWEQFRSSLESRHVPLRVLESLDGNRLNLVGCCSNSSKQSIIAALAKFFDESITVSSPFPGDPGRLKYIESFQKEEVEKTAREFGVEVQITVEAIVMKGKATQVDRCEKQLRALHDKIIDETHDVTQKHHMQMIQSDPVIIQDIGAICRTLIVNESLPKHADVEIMAPPAQKDDVLYQTRLPKTGINLILKNTKLDEIRDCDVLLLPNNSSLELKTELGTYVLEQGGNSIREECRKQSKVVPGKIVKTVAGDLPFNYIIHAVIPDWKGHSMEEKRLTSALKRSFDANDDVTMVIPMSGFNDYPYPKLINVVLSCLKEGDDENSLPARVVLQESDKACCDMILEAVAEKFGPDTSKRLLQMQPSAERVSARPVRPRPSLQTQEARSVPQPASASSSSPSAQAIQSGPITVIGPNELQIHSIVRFYVSKGRLEESQQQALVNSTGESLNLNDNPLARALAARAGPQLQAACSTLAPIQPGEVKETPGFSLECNKIFHCRVGSSYEGAISEQSLKKLIMKCLNMADQSGFRSIVFPALGTGVLRYPPDVVAKLLIDSTVDFVGSNKSTSLREVWVVVFESDHVTQKGFDNVLQGMTNQSTSATPAVAPLLPPTQPMEPYGAKPKKNKKNKKKKEAETSRDVMAEAADSFMVQVESTKISVLKGDICNIRTDAIVCTTNKDFVMQGAVARTLIADPVVQNAVYQNRGMPPTGVYPVPAGAFPAKYILMIDSFMPWEKLVQNCLETCSQSKWASVAFPALGTGNFGKTASEMAKLLMQTLVDYVKAQKGATSLKHIHFVIFQDGMYKEFQSTLKKMVQDKPSGIFRVIQSAYNFFFGTDSSMAEEASEYEPSPVAEDVVRLRIYGPTRESIVNTVTKLDSRLSKETHCILWSERHNYSTEAKFISQLSEHQIGYLEELATDKSVMLEVDKDLLDIKIEGVKAAAYDVRDEVLEQIRELEKIEAESRQSDYLESKIQWEYEDENEKWKPFHWEDSLRLEESHLLNSAAIFEFESKRWRDNVKVDLQKKKATLDGTKRSIKRKNLIADKFPDHWDEDAGDTVVLKADSTEFKEVEQNFRRTLGGSFGKLQFLQVKRVQHYANYTQYMVQRKFVADKLQKPENQVEKTPLWHGSSEGSIDKIVKSFFNRNFAGANATAYGSGSYFARDSSYSVNYAQPNPNGERFMFQARVVIGDYTTGAHGMKDAPNKPSGEQYDSVVNNVTDPSIFVVFKDVAAYPEYIIKFKV